MSRKVPHILISALLCALPPCAAAQVQTDSLSLDIKEVVFVVADPTSALRGSTVSTIDWNLEGLDALPKIFGNSDPVRYLQFLPGVQTNSEFDAGIHIQGCDNSHNEVSIEGVPLYGVTHLFGFFSVFNPSHFTRMRLDRPSGTATTARIGGTVDMKLPDSVPEKVSGEASLGIMSAQGTLKIPLGKKSGLFVSARQSFLNLLYRRWMKLDGVQVRYGFGDYDLTWYYVPARDDRIWIDLYCGWDRMSMGESHFDGTTELDWNNHLAAVHWQHSFSGKVQMTHSLFGSGFRFNLDFAQSGIYLKLPSYIESFGYKGKVRSGDFLSGVNVTWYDVLPQSPCLDGTYNEAAVPQERQTGLEASLYSTYDHTFGYRWQLRAGLYGSMFRSPDKEFFWNLSPSASLSYHMYRAGALTLSYGWRHQYLFQTGLTSLGLPTEFWFLSGRHSRPQMSQYVSLGYEVPLFREAVAVSAEAYYKRLYNQVDYRGDAFDFLNSAYSLDNVLLKGRGYNYGFNVMVHKQAGMLTGWLSYSYGRALRRFNNPDYPSVYPTGHERIHEFSAVAACHLGKWDFGATFVFASGTPFTAPKSYYLVSGVIIPEYGEHNANRLRPYIRLDLSVNYSIVRNDRRECGLNFSLYNATARKNDLMYRLRVRDGRFAYRPMSFFMTLVPSVSYYHKF